MKLSLDVSEYVSLNVPGFKGIRAGHSYTSITSAATQLVGLHDYEEVNVRDPMRDEDGKLIGPVIKAIMETLQNNPEYMAVKSRGLLILAESVEYRRLPGGRNVLDLNLNDKRIHGLVDGGHTYATLVDYYKDAVDKSNLGDSWLPIKILTGVRNGDTAEIADGQNTSRQVDKSSMMNNRGEFNILKDALGPDQKLVSWFYGDNQETAALTSDDIVKMMLLFHPKYTEDNHPTDIYRGKSKAINTYQELVNNDKPLARALASQLRQIIRLAELIEHGIPIVYNDNESRQFGKLKFVAKSDRILPFTRLPMDYRVPIGWIYPILAGFRALTHYKDGIMTWKKEPEAFVPTILKRVVLPICLNDDKRTSSEPSKQGNSATAYNIVYSKIQVAAKVD